MLGLGSSIISGSSPRADIVKDGLVLRHDYKDKTVELCSSGAGAFDEGNDQINIGNVFTFGREDFSITTWVKWDVTSTASGESYIISKIVDSNNTMKLTKFVFSLADNAA